MKLSESVACSLHGKFDPASFVFVLFLNHTEYFFGG